MICWEIVALWKDSSDHFCFRSSHQRCSIKIGLLKNFLKFAGKHLCQSLFQVCNIIKIRLWHRSFPVNFAKFLRTPIYRTLLGVCFCLFQCCIMVFLVFKLLKVDPFQPSFAFHIETSNLLRKAKQSKWWVSIWNAALGRNKLKIVELAVIPFFVLAVFRDIFRTLPNT